MMFTLSDNYTQEVIQDKKSPDYYEKNVTDIEKTISMFESLSQAELQDIVEDLKSIEDKSYELLNKLILDNNTVRKDMEENERLDLEVRKGLDMNKEEEIAQIFNQRVEVDETKKRAIEELEFQKSKYERNLDKLAQIERDLLKNLDMNRALRKSAKMVRDNAREQEGFLPPFSIDSLSKSSEFIPSTSRNRIER